MIHSQVMRLVGRDIQLKTIFASNITAGLLLIAVVYFAYLNYNTLPFVFKMRDRVEIAKVNLQKAEEHERAIKLDIAESASDEAKQRYQKQFFNTLEEGEYLVLLHKDVPSKPVEEVRNMTQIEKISQKIKLWWKNLRL